MLMASLTKICFEGSGTRPAPHRHEFAVSLLSRWSETADRSAPRKRTVVEISDVPNRVWGFPSGYVKLSGLAGDRAAAAERRFQEADLLPRTANTTGVKQ